MNDPAQALARLEELRQAGEGVLRGAHARIEEAQAGLLRAARDFPGRVRSELGSLDRLISETKRDADRHREEFRRRFLEGLPEDAELRAHLLTMDMEYASRVKVAEEGIKGLLASLDAHLQGMTGGVERYCAEAREAIGGELYPAHSRLADALKEAVRQLKGYEVRLGRLTAEPGRSEEAQLRAMEEAAAEEAWRMMTAAGKLRRDNEARITELEKRLAREEAQTREAEASARRFAEALQVEKAQRIADSGERQRLAAEVERLRGQAAVQAETGLSEEALELQRVKEEVARLRLELRQAKEEGAKAAPVLAPEKEAELKELREKALRWEEERIELRNNFLALRKRLLELQESGAKPFDQAMWAAEKEEMVEQLTAAQREAATLRAAYESAQVSWEQTLARQDARRLDEIFRLRAELDDLKLRVREGLK